MPQILTQSVSVLRRRCDGYWTMLCASSVVGNINDVSVTAFLDSEWY
jgi:hypothetical protein